MNTRAAAAVTAQETAERLRGSVGFVARALAVIGIRAPSVRAAADAAREAQQAKHAAKGVRLHFRDDLIHADRTGTAEAARRQLQQDQWEDRSDVKAARKEEAETRQVVAAVKAGDPEIKEILKEQNGLRLARDLAARRKAETLTKMNRHQQLHDPQTATGTSLQPGPAMLAPAFRS